MASSSSISNIALFSRFSWNTEGNLSSPCRIRSVGRKNFPTSKYDWDFSFTSFSCFHLAIQRRQIDQELVTSLSGRVERCTDNCCTGLKRLHELTFLYIPALWLVNCPYHYLHHYSTSPLFDSETWVAAYSRRDFWPCTHSRDIIYMDKTYGVVDYSTFITQLMTCSSTIWL